LFRAQAILEAGRRSTDEKRAITIPYDKDGNLCDFPQ